MEDMAVFGGGCFWCTEAVFKNLRGVRSVTPGYAGGHTTNPFYEKVLRGGTGHAEAVKIMFDPAQIRYTDLLTVFFGTHDPTTRNRQGNDIGPQYRSLILYASAAQKEEAERYIRELQPHAPRPIVTEVLPLENFYEAEEHHRDYFARNGTQPYCEFVIAPKIEKLRKDFGDLLKTHQTTT